jgi:hypothetical protein
MVEGEALMDCPILLKAREIYDRPGDRAPHETEFLLAVHRVTTNSVRLRGQAIQEYGYGSAGAEAAAERVYRAERQGVVEAWANFEQALEEA